ncbi:unnamed protein product [Adineta ricciae]|uniref:Uncharacterized protein n=1 Tax=Adineta ricciae TaxID=249248 RepID=A0A814YJ33_ADIRI|nr:unnamed protein product [Adineta ricciae]
MQRIVVDGHEWEVPSEPEWEEIVKEATAAQQRVFKSCRTTSECRQIVAEFSAIFDRYPKYKHFYETHKAEVNLLVSSYELNVDTVIAHGNLFF